MMQTHTGYLSQFYFLKYVISKQFYTIYNYLMTQMRTMKWVDKLTQKTWQLRAAPQQEWTPLLNIDQLIQIRQLRG